MTIEFPGAASGTGGAPESDFLNNFSKTFDGIVKESVALLNQRRNSQGNWCQGNRNHLAAISERVMPHLIDFCGMGIE